MYLKFLNNERVDGREDIGLHIEKKLFVRRLGGGASLQIMDKRIRMMIAVTLIIENTYR